MYVLYLYFICTYLFASDPTYSGEARQRCNRTSSPTPHVAERAPARAHHAARRPSAASAAAGCMAARAAAHRAAIAMHGNMVSARRGSGTSFAISGRTAASSRPPGRPCALRHRASESSGRCIWHSSPMPPSLRCRPGKTLCRELSPGARSRENLKIRQITPCTRKIRPNRLRYRT